MKKTSRGDLEKVVGKSLFDLTCPSCGEAGSYKAYITKNKEDFFCVLDCKCGIAGHVFQMSAEQVKMSLASEIERA